MMRLSLLILLFCFISLSFCSENDSASQLGLMKYDGTSKSSAELKRKFDYYTQQYFTKLEYAKKKAISLGDAEEVKRIDQALNGAYINDFSSNYGVAARKYYDQKLVEVVTRFSKDLEADIKSLLVAGKTDDALFVKDMVTFLEQYKTVEEKDDKGKTYKKFTVEADKDWQDVGLVLKPNTRVVVENTGTWAPGAFHSRGRPDRANADTYNLQIRVKGDSYRGGVSWDFVTQSGGAVSARMLPLRRAALSEARGELKVRLTLYEQEEKTPADKSAASESLETVLRNIISPPEKDVTAEKKIEGSKPNLLVDKRSYNEVIKSDEELHKTRINVSKGDKITINAVGTWTPNIDKSPESSADIYRYLLNIGKKRQGQGGKVWTFTASEAGIISLSPSFYAWSNKRGYKSSGSLKLRIEIEPVQ